MNDRDRLRLFALLSALEEGVLAESGRDELVALLKSSDEAQDLYLAYQGLSSSLSLYAREHVIASDDEPVALAELAEMEARAETIPQSMLDLPFSLEPKSEGQPDYDITLMRALDDLRWAAGKAATKLICSPFGITSAIAAILILGIYLFAPFGSTDEQTPQDIADNTPSESTEPGRVGPVLNTPVATLTASHDAKWSPSAEGALARGSDLHAGTRLTLTAGFATITTHDGAVAILEAPATIQLINHNALHLHAGKLVGICETESSKGFLVRTPHMDITDLGTRFGVDSNSQATEVHVFEGEIEAHRPDAAPDAQPVTLVANQSARTSADTTTITRIDHDADRFAALLPDPNRLPGTGFGLKVGDTDPNWQIVAIDGQPLGTPRPLTVGGQNHSRTHPNDPATSQWFTWNPPEAERKQDECLYLVRTTLDLPQSIASPGAYLALQYMADNELRAVHINGQRIALPEVDVRDMFTKFHQATIDRHLKPGQNTIAFELVNLRINGGESGEAGFRIAWDLVTPTTPPPGDTR